MKQVVIISGSRRSGNTLAIAKMYRDELCTHNCEVDIIDLSKISFNLCDGCLLCDDNQKCKFEDGFDSFIDKIRTADLVMFGSPARWRLMSGEMKAFMDRMNPYAAVEGYSGINVFIFAVGQSSAEEGQSILDAIESMASFAHDAGMNIMGKQAFYGMYGSEDYHNEETDTRNTCKNNIDSLIEKLA